MRYVGVDVSLTNTAVVSIDKDGKITSSIGKIGYTLSDDDDVWKETERAVIITNAVVGFIDGCKFSAIEGYAYQAKGKRTYQIGELGGMIRSEIFKRSWNHKPVFISPTSLKKFATGGGRADKKKIRECVEIIWGFDCKDDNIVDAFVLAQMMRYSDPDLRDLVPMMDFQLDALKASGLL
ncbi:MAG: hypothetical protein QNK24_10355 [Desulfuromusa sp.]|nr:hypothetical protein [Desulfuromusa sp.]